MSITATTLKDFEQRCRAASETPQDVGQFHQIIATASEALDINQRGLARLLEVSPASVTRYGQGKNAPHPTLRRAMYDVLADEARSHARELQRQEGGANQARQRANVGRGRSSPPRVPVGAAMAAKSRND